jgi:hypothetical protein
MAKQYLEEIKITVGGRSFVLSVRTAQEIFQKYKICNVVPLLVLHFSIWIAGYRLHKSTATCQKLFFASDSSTSLIVQTSNDY